jgi:hypothetical protein
MVSAASIHEFTQETGIRVNHFPTPEDNRAQLQLMRDLLQRGVSTDVYGIDTIWSGALAEYLVDLKPYLSPMIGSKRSSSSNSSFRRRSAHGARASFSISARPCALHSLVFQRRPSFIANACN